MANRNSTIDVTADASISQSAPDDNYGGETTLTLRGNGNDRVLLLFNLDEIPAASNITSAICRLYVNSISPGSANTTVSAYAIANEPIFVEDQVTWNNATSLLTWTEAGVLRTGQAAVGQVIVTPSDDSIDIDITIAVYDWHKRRIKNAGLLLVASGSNETITCSSREGVAAPDLSVTYTHHETLSQAGKERWYIKVYDQDDNLIFDDKLPYAPETVSITQELPIEEVSMINQKNHHILAWKLSDATYYDAPFDSNTIEGLMIERTQITRQWTFTWNVKDASFLRQWWIWTEMGCTIYLYPGQRYDPTRYDESKPTLGKDCYNVWADWQYIDPDRNFRLWKNGVEVCNSVTSNGWSIETRGGRLATTTAHAFQDKFNFLGHYRWHLQPIEVIPSYHAIYSDRNRTSVATFQVVCVELDYAFRQFGEELSEYE